MLKHLPDSIAWFGVSLLSTKKFESFNGVLRNASVHSNWHQTGRDLALSFLNYQALHFVLSNAQLYNYKTHMAFHASNQVTEIFWDNFLIQKSMGYNQLMVEPPLMYPTIILLSPGRWYFTNNLQTLFTQQCPVFHADFPLHSPLSGNHWACWFNLASPMESPFPTLSQNHCVWPGQYKPLLPDGVFAQ